MSIETTYTNARANLAKLLDAAVDDRETIIIKRRGAEDVVLIAADEFRSFLETAHLLRSPANAERLLAALERSRRGEALTMTLDELRREAGLDEEA
jgi:antitoxin YefM